MQEWISHWHTGLPAVLTDLAPVIQTEEELLSWLEPRIQELLDHDFQGLLQLLYRIDVSEKKAKQAFEEAYPTSPAGALARLILDRQKQKAITRMQFSKD